MLDLPPAPEPSPRRGYRLPPDQRAWQADLDQIQRLVFLDTPRLAAGRQFQVVDTRQAWGEDRVYFWEPFRLDARSASSYIADERSLLPRRPREDQDRSVLSPGGADAAGADR